MLNLKPPQNPNYCATVVELKHFAPLAGCDNVQAALIYGNQVIVGKDTKPGDIGIFFPVETALSREFLAANNLYRKPEWGNVDPAKKGFFEEHGRVKCVKFRGHRSEGFWIPLDSLNYISPEIKRFINIGNEFDTIELPKEFIVQNQCLETQREKTSSVLTTRRKTHNPEICVTPAIENGCLTTTRPTESRSKITKISGDLLQKVRHTLQDIVRSGTEKTKIQNGTNETKEIACTFESTEFPLSSMNKCTTTSKGSVKSAMVLEKDCQLTIVTNLEKSEDCYAMPAISPSDSLKNLKEYPEQSNTSKRKFEICRKYVPARNPGRLYSAPKARGRAEDRIAAGQFNYHIDTAKLDRNIHKLQPTDIISITEKWHGTSAIFAHVLTNRPLKWYERALAALGVRIERTEYAHVWASRRVIKGVGGQPREGVVHYYKSDIWGTVFEEVKDLIPKGYTLYGEIVGWTPDGAPIQAGYHYGCPTGAHEFVVYRITYTNPEGVVMNLSWPQIKEFCAARGLETVKESYYGYAKDFLPKGALFINPEDAYKSDWKMGDILPDGKIIRSQTDDEWQSEFVTVLKRNLVEDKMCLFNPGMPAEGVVLRIESAREFEAYKCKSFAFLANESKQLDKGVVDMETIEAENVSEN